MIERLIENLIEALERNTRAAASLEAALCIPSAERITAALAAEFPEPAPAPAVQPEPAPISPIEGKSKAELILYLTEVAKDLDRGGALWRSIKERIQSHGSDKLPNLTEEQVRDVANFVAGAL